MNMKIVDPGEGCIVLQKKGKEKHSGKDSEFREEEKIQVSGVLKIAKREGKERH